MKPIKPSSKSFKYLLSRFLIFTTTIPMFIFGLISLIISFNVLKTELLEANEREVDLIVKSSMDYLSEAENILYSLILLFNNEDEADKVDSYLKIKKIITESHKFILGIQVADKNGIVKSIYPKDNLIIGSDISGHDYFKKIITSKGHYWSSSFMSEIRDFPVVSISSSTPKHIITLFLSLEGISSLSINNQKNVGNYITITDQKGVYISHPDGNKVSLRQNDLTFQYFKNKWEGVKLSEELEHEGEKYLTSIYFLPGINWKIALYLPMKELYTPGKYLGFWLMVISISFIIIVLIFGSRTNKMVNSSFLSLITSTKEIAQGNYNFPIPQVKYSEFKELLNSFNSMVIKIKSRENDLLQTHKEIEMHKNNLETMVKKRTKELNNTIENLQLTQKQLVESEKMASLGELVAGVSHEINTPLGIIVTSASYLDDEVNDIHNKIESGKLTKTNLLNFTKNIKDSLDLILSNSKRSSELIQSFKQVSADQTSEFKRKFNMHEYLEEIINSLKPQFRNKDIKVNIICKQDMEIDSYPGAFAQIITNLVLNSIIHGFDKSNCGEITIEAIKDNDISHIKYIDNGKGMDKESSTKLFEPFFTTKRGRGGTGLGMHIVYNVVTQKLKGTIICDSSPENGVEFNIELPVLV